MNNRTKTPSQKLITTLLCVCSVLLLIFTSFIPVVEGCIEKIIKEKKKTEVRNNLNNAIDNPRLISKELETQNTPHALCYIIYFEARGWTIGIRWERTMEHKETRDVYSNPTVNAFVPSIGKYPGADDIERPPPDTCIDFLILMFGRRAGSVIIHNVPGLGVTIHGVLIPWFIYSSALTPLAERLVDFSLKISKVWGFVIVDLMALVTAGLAHYLQTVPAYISQLLAAFSEFWVAQLLIVCRPLGIFIETITLIATLGVTTLVFIEVFKRGRI